MSFKLKAIMEASQQPQIERSVAARSSVSDEGHFPRPDALIGRPERPRRVRRRGRKYLSRRGANERRGSIDVVNAHLVERARVDHVSRQRPVIEERVLEPKRELKAI